MRKSWKIFFWRKFFVKPPSVRGLACPKDYKFTKNIFSGRVPIGTGRMCQTITLNWQDLAILADVSPKLARFSFFHNNF